MNEKERKFFTELCILSILREGPSTVYDMLMKMDAQIGLENASEDMCLYYLRKEAYCSLRYEWDGKERRGIYYITPKGEMYFSLHNQYFKRCKETIKKG